MRDVDSDFGTITTAAPSSGAASYAEFPYGINAGEGGNLGKICKLYVRVKVEGSKAVPSTDTITIQVLHKEDTGAGTLLATHSEPAKAMAVGDSFVFELPAEHKQYISLKGAASATAGITLHAYIEMGERD